MYERFMNESSLEFDDSSDEDYVQSGEGSDSEAPSVVLEEIECEYDNDIFLSKDPSKKELMMKLKKVMKDRKKQKTPETFETKSREHERASEGENEDDLVRKVLRNWCIKNGVDIEFLRNEATRVTAKCKVEGCEWRIHASPIQDGPAFQIKTLKGKHTCARTYENKIGNTSYLAARIENAIRDHPTIPIQQLKIRILSKCNVDVNRFKLLVAMGKDGNDNMFPIAVFILQVENRDTWGWFVGYNKGSCKNEIHPKSKSFKAAARGTRNEAARVTHLPAPRTTTQAAARGTGNEAARNITSCTKNCNPIGYFGPRTEALLGDVGSASTQTGSSIPANKSKGDNKSSLES
ncbi:UNVERIFIED_CONTAM: hypothetical protein Scaly_2247600 [Sesamum calycinum]|uniref:Transposase MuDR plant domain-containing protein n=1 Tax=Sesamum calycinum TaxID=2727403 RepID=A0AAW2MC64_9LAMI